MQSVDEDNAANVIRVIAEASKEVNLLCNSIRWFVNGGKACVANCSLRSRWRGVLLPFLISSWLQSLSGHRQHTMILLSLVVCNRTFTSSREMTSYSWSRGNPTFNLRVSRQPHWGRHWLANGRLSGKSRVERDWHCRPNAEVVKARCSPAPVLRI